MLNFLKYEKYYFIFYSRNDLKELNDQIIKNQRQKNKMNKIEKFISELYNNKFKFNDKFDLLLTFNNIITVLNKGFHIKNNQNILNINSLNNNFINKYLNKLLRNNIIINILLEKIKINKIIKKIEDEINIIEKKLENEKITHINNEIINQGMNQGMNQKTNEITNQEMNHKTNQIINQDINKIKEIKLIIDSLKKLDNPNKIEEKKNFIKKIFEIDLNSLPTIKSIKRLLDNNNNNNNNNNVKNKVIKPNKIELYCDKNNLINNKTKNSCFKLNYFNKENNIKQYNSKIKKIIEYLRNKFLSNTDSCLIINYKRIGYNVFIKNETFEFTDKINIFNIKNSESVPKLIELNNMVVTQVNNIVIKLNNNDMQKGGGERTRKVLKVIAHVYLYASFFTLIGLFLIPVTYFILSFFNSRNKSKGKYVKTHYGTRKRTVANNFDNLFENK